MLVKPGHDRVLWKAVMIYDLTSVAEGIVTTFFFKALLYIVKQQLHIFS